MDLSILNKVHNFGIYRKGGKRCILQLDFLGRILLVIHKGHIKKTHSLDHLQHFDSEDGLHISLKSREGELEFEADNTEEKYSICRLLGLAMQTNLEEDEDSIDSGQGHLPMCEHDVIKDGILDKKGNTTFTTWNKRRVKLMPGELAYYKPGEELALNVIQLWQDRCALKKQSYNGLTLTVRERVYSFRIANEYRATHMTEIARDDWFEAFEKALNHVPPTARLLDMSIFSTNSSNNSTVSDIVCPEISIHHNDETDSNLNTDAEHIYDVTPDELTRISRCDKSDDEHIADHNTQLSGRQATPPIMYIDEPPPLPKSKSLGRRHSSDNLLSTTPAMMIFTDTSFQSSPKETLRASSKFSVSQCDLSSLQASHDAPRTKGNEVDPMDSVFSGTAAAFRAQLAQRGGKSSSLKTYRANKEIMTIKKNHGRKKGGWMQSHNFLVQSADKTLQIRSFEAEQKKAVHPGWEAIFPQAKTTVTRTQSLEIQEEKGLIIPATTLNNSFSGDVTPPVCQSETVFAVRKMQDRPHVASPSPHLSRPAIAPPPPPPPLPVTKIITSARRRSSSEFKLKQVHWIRINTSQVPWSVWKDARDRTSELDLFELEQQFALNETKQASIKLKNEEDKKMLVDPKRAQNLGILFSGLKLDSLVKLREALNSITEMESFPVDKLKTLKRYQPTAEEVELYCLYGSRRDGLHDVDVFMLELCQIPRLGTRVELVVTLWEFPAQHAALEEEITDLVTACDQLLGSDSLVTILEYLLAIGNHMNSTWGNKQDALGFQLSSLDKVLTVKGKDAKTTLCSFLVKQLRRNSPGLLQWTETVGHVSKCSGYSVKAVGAEIDVLKNDLQKIKRTLKVLRTQVTTEKRFYMDVQNFIVEYDLKLDLLDIKYEQVAEKCKQLMMMFGEPSTKSADAMLAGISLLVEAFNQAKAAAE